MNNKKIDIDNMFAQLREEAQPTPLRKLIEPRPSGALFVLKKSVSMSLLSARTLWLGIGCVCGALAVAGGVLYNTLNTTRPHKTQTAPAVVKQMAETPRPMPVTTEYQMPSAMETAADGPVQPIAPNATSAHGATDRADSHTAIDQSNEERATEDNLIVQPASELNAVTAASYRDASLASVSPEPVTSAPALLPTPEEFPLAAQEDGLRGVSLMMDGAALLADIVQVQGEVRLTDRLSGGLLLGVGNVRGRSADVSHTFFLAGAQVNYYLLGDFREGLQIGAEALFSSTDVEVHNTFLYRGGRTLSLIPYAGYKYILASGLTLNLQAGVGAATPVFIPVTTETFDNTEYKWHVSHRIQMNIGWSL